MMKLFTILISFLIFNSINVFSFESKKEETLEARTQDIYNYKKNSVSNVEFYSTNFGVFGHNRRFDDYGKLLFDSAGTFWPRGSRNAYIYGGGIWFTGTKYSEKEMRVRKYCEMSYNPNNISSFFVPGHINDGDTLFPEFADRNRLYSSGEFNNSGEPKSGISVPNWPLWVSGQNQINQFGVLQNDFVYDTLLRNSQDYPLGPLFVSDEDIFSFYKDTDLEISPKVKEYKAKDYPLRLQVTQSIYSWDTEELKDVVVLYYNFENNSTDTLRDCWLASVYDFDIVSQYGSEQNNSRTTNDRVRYFSEDKSLNLIVAWSDSTFGEKGNGLGYVGLTLLETPAVDQDGFIRTDRNLFLPNEQLGAKTFLNWNIHEDFNEDYRQYDITASLRKDSTQEPNDIRCLISSGFFHLLPGAKARFAVALCFALPAKGFEADGTFEDINGIFNSGKASTLNSDKASLIEKINYLNRYYYKELPLSVEDKNITSIDFISIYPNPTEKIINLSYANELSGYINIDLYNTTGEKVDELFSGFVISGTQNYKFILNSKNLNSGLYYIRISSTGGVTTKSINIIK